MKRLIFLSLVSLSTVILYSCADDKSENGGGNGGQTGSFIAEATPCLAQMVEGCADIANEVGTSKIGEPYDLWIEGNTTAAVYAVESWYSWHSRDDYSNNILSIANTYAGTTNSTANINSGGINWAVSNNSLAYFLSVNNPALDAQVRDAINHAWVAIQNIPQPFRNNINSAETLEAMEACADLEDILSNRLETYVMNLTSDYDTQLNMIVAAFVDNVVVPTYSDLTTGNQALYNEVKKLADVLLGSDAASADFSAACQAWLNARAPWEKSEAFLFGPVDALGLDPNMDSWPLDQDEIVKILTSGNFDDLDWSNGDDDDAIEAAQNVRGYHTLEFLLFKNGQPRKVLATGGSTQADNLDVTPANSKSWANYMVQVANLLLNDSNDLYDAWTKSYEGGKSYGSKFKSFDI